MALSPRYGPAHSQSSAATTTSDGTTNLPNPWLDNPTPKSQQYPGIQFRLKNFVSHNLNMRVPESSWPYRLYREARILFYEFRGYGPPPADVGFPGDIYLDLTYYPGSGNLLYWFEGEWTCCNWSSNPNTTLFQTQKHPLLTDRFLWGSEKRGFTWATYQTLRRNLRNLLSYDPAPVIISALKYDGVTNNRFPALVLTEENIRRRDAEICRRKQEREEWAKTTSISSSSSRRTIRSSNISGSSSINFTENPHYLATIQETTEKDPQVDVVHDSTNNIPSLTPEPPIVPSKKRYHPDASDSTSPPTKRIKTEFTSGLKLGEASDRNGENQEDDSDDFHEGATGTGAENCQGKERHDQRSFTPAGEYVLTPESLNSCCHRSWRTWTRINDR